MNGEKKVIIITICIRNMFYICQSSGPGVAKRRKYYQND